MITETNTTLLGAVVLGAARMATVGQHRTCHIYTTATAPVPAAAVTWVVAAARPTGSPQWEQSRTQTRQRRRPILSLTCSVTNRPRLLGVVAHTQKRNSVLLDGATQMDEST
jgi:hypothetical protein